MELVYNKIYKFNQRLILYKMSGEGGNSNIWSACGMKMLHLIVSLILNRISNSGPACCLLYSEVAKLEFHPGRALVFTVIY